jgi:hypothetical protein
MMMARSEPAGVFPAHHTSDAELCGLSRSVARILRVHRTSRTPHGVRANVAIADVVLAGDIGPTEAVRVALQNGASIASLLPATGRDRLATL